MGPCFKPAEEKTRKRILNRRNIIGVLSVAVLSASVTTPGHAEMTVEIGGRIDAIYTYYDEDEIDMGSGSEFRRARLFAQGDIDQNTNVASFDILEITGGSFGPEFAGGVNVSTWGTGTLAFNSCNSLTLNYDGVDGTIEKINVKYI